jgi:hypothetical protein
MTVRRMRMACREPKACCFTTITIARCHLNVTSHVRQISISPCHSPARLQCRPLYSGLPNKTLYAFVTLSHSWPISCSSYQQLFHQLDRIWWDVDSTKFPLHCVVRPLLTTYPLGLNVPISTLVSNFSLCSSLIITDQVAYPLKNKVIFHQTARQNGFWTESHQKFPVVNLFLLYSHMQFNLLMWFWYMCTYIYIYIHIYINKYLGGKIKYLRELICITDFLTVHVCRSLFESTEIVGNKTYTENFQIDFSWLLEKK